MKNSGFLAWAEPDPKKTDFFWHFKVPFDSPAHSLQETVLPETSGNFSALGVFHVMRYINVRYLLTYLLLPIESRDSERCQKVVM